MKKLATILFILISIACYSQAYFLPSPFAKIKLVWNSHSVPVGINQDSTWLSLAQYSKVLNWSLLGNAGTSSTTNFLGTTDVIPLVFRVNNLRSGYIDTIGTTIFGYRALKLLSSGTRNTAIGYKALTVNTSGQFNTATGFLSLTSNTTGRNTAYGHESGQFNTTGTSNTIFGDVALAFNQTGNNNTVVGFAAMQACSTVVSSNTIIGYQSFITGAGNNNTSLGSQALIDGTTTSGNTGIGTLALGVNETGSNNTALGYLADVKGINYTNATAIGYNAKVGKSNAVSIGDTSLSTNVGIGTIIPSATLHVKGTMRYVDGNQGSSKVLSSDANGNATWSTVAAAGGGTVTSVASGYGLTGGTITSTGTLKVDTTSGTSNGSRVATQYYVNHNAPFLGGGIAYLDSTQSFGGINTFNGDITISGNASAESVFTVRQTSLRINNSANTFFTTIKGGQVSANRSFVIPALTGSDTICGVAFPHILTNKYLGSGTKMKLGSDATGDVYYNSGGGTVSRLGIGGSGEVLTVAGGVPTWAAGGGAGTVTSIATGNGITGGTITTTGTLGLSGATGDIGSFSATNTYSAIAAATAGKLLRAAGASTLPTWSTPTFPNAATTTGAYIRADGTNFIQSTEILPNSSTLGYITHSTATNTLGESSHLQFTADSILRVNPAKLPASQAAPIQFGASKILQGDISQNNVPTFIEFVKGDGAGAARTARSSIGAMGALEINLGSNFDYTTGVHRYYDATKIATWQYLSNDATDALGYQYVPANNPNNVDIYTTYGCRPFYVENINQPSTGKGISGFSRVNTAILSLADATNTSSVTATASTISMSGGVTLFGGGSGIARVQSSTVGTSIGAKSTFGNAQCILDANASTNACGTNYQTAAANKWFSGTGILASTNTDWDVYSFVLGNTVMRLNSVGNLLASGKIFVGGLAITPTALLHLAAGTATANTAPLKFTTGTNLTVAVDGAMEYDGTSLFFTNSGAQRQQLVQSQETRVSTQYDNTTTTVGNITGLTATLVAGKTYSFEATLHVTKDAVGGEKYTMGGTATATAIIYEILAVDNSGNLNTITARQTALGSTSGQASGTTGYTKIVGVITVNAAGTLTPQFSENAAVGTGSILVGSTFVVKQIP